MNKKAIVQTIEGRKYVQLEGSHYEMGFQHGEALRDMIVDHVGGQRKYYAAVFGDRVEEALEFACSVDGEYVSRMRQYTPELIEEAQGIADGAGIALRDVFMLNTFEELTEAAPEKMQLDLMDFNERCGEAEKLFKGCSSASFRRSNGNVVCGSSMDFAPHLARHGIVLHLKRSDGFEILGATLAGHYDMYGVNNAGLSVQVTTIPNLAKSDNFLGLGSAACQRLLLNQVSYEEAKRVLLETRMLSGLSYQIGTPDQYGILESSDRGVWAHSGEQQCLTNYAVLADRKISIPGVYDESGAPIINDGASYAQMVERRENLKQFIVDQPSTDALKYELSHSVNNSDMPAFAVLYNTIFEFALDKIHCSFAFGADPERKWIDLVLDYRTSL